MTPTDTLDAAHPPGTRPRGAWHSTACILCECNCGLQVELGGPSGRNFVRVRGDDAHPASLGYACEKASRVEYYQNGGARLTQPMRRRDDGTYEPIDWDTAIREVADRLAAVRDTAGGERILYYGGGGQGNHLPGLYSRATRAALGMKYQSSALAQEKTGEIHVIGNMVGGITRSDFEHCEVALLIGKNPWLSHGIPRARVTLREIARDAQRTLIVIDPRRTETAEIADVHLQVRPGADAFLLAAMVATVVQENLLASDWLAEHASGLDQVVPLFRHLPIDEYASKAGVDASLVRSTARRIATARSVASFEDLGVQMNRHSTLVSYLHKLLVLLTGHFGRPGTMYRPTSMVPITGAVTAYASMRRTPVTAAPIVGGLMPCNAIPEEILGDSPARFRAMIVETGNPAHSLADSERMRKALSALDLLVVIDVAMSETARLAHYVLPVCTQYEKAEATFFNFEFPKNVFHLRRALLEPEHGLFSEAELHSRLVDALGALPAEAVATLRAAWDAGRPRFARAFASLIAEHPSLVALAPVLLYRAIGDRLPPGTAEGAGLWAVCQLAAKRHLPSLNRAGYAGAPHEAAEALFDAILATPSGVVFSVDDWSDSLQRIDTPDRRIRLDLPEFHAELAALRDEPAPTAPADLPLILSAGERRSYTANTIIRNPGWRRKDPEGALCMHPDDARDAGVEDGGLARLQTRRGSATVSVSVSERMQRGHVSLPNGMGVDFESADGTVRTVGVAPNELTDLNDRDPFAGTPWHKFVPARVSRLDA